MAQGLKDYQQNTFSDGMEMDSNPLAVKASVMTHCLNGTVVTYDGNEFTLQNQEGNVRVHSAKLHHGFIPLGMQEYNGIIYVVSYNPINELCEIGSFPSPERNFTPDDFNGSDCIIQSSFFDLPTRGDIDSNSKGIVSYVTKLFNEQLFLLNPGDKYAIKVVCENPSSLTATNLDNTDGVIDVDEHDEYLDYVSDLWKIDKSWDSAGQTNPNPLRKLIRLKYFEILDDGLNEVDPKDVNVFLMDKNDLTPMPMRYVTGSSGTGFAVGYEYEKLDYFDCSIHERTNESDEKKVVVLNVVGKGSDGADGVHLNTMTECSVRVDGLNFEYLDTNNQPQTTDTVILKEPFQLVLEEIDISNADESLRDPKTLSFTVIPKSSYQWFPDLELTKKFSVGDYKSKDTINEIFKYYYDDDAKLLRLDFDAKYIPDPEKNNSMYLEFYDPWSDISLIYPMESGYTLDNKNSVFINVVDLEDKTFEQNNDDLDFLTKTGEYRNGYPWKNIECIDRIAYPNTTTPNLYSNNGDVFFASETSTVPAQFSMTKKELVKWRFYMVNICYVEQSKDLSEVKLKVTPKCLFVTDKYNDTYVEDIEQDFTQLDFKLDKYQYKFIHTNTYDDYVIDPIHTENTSMINELCTYNEDNAPGTALDDYMYFKVYPEESSGPAVNIYSASSFFQTKKRETFRQYIVGGDYIYGNKYNFAEPVYPIMNETETNQDVSTEDDAAETTTDMIPMRTQLIIQTRVPSTNNMNNISVEILLGTNRDLYAPAISEIQSMRFPGKVFFSEHAWYSTYRDTYPNATAGSNNVVGAWSSTSNANGSAMGTHPDIGVNCEDGVDCYTQGDGTNGWYAFHNMATVMFGHEGATTYGLSPDGNRKWHSKLHENIEESNGFAAQILNSMEDRNVFSVIPDYSFFAAYVKDQKGENEMTAQQSNGGAITAGEVSEASETVAFPKYDDGVLCSDVSHENYLKPLVKLETTQYNCNFATCNTSDMYSDSNSANGRDLKCRNYIDFLENTYIASNAMQENSLLYYPYTGIGSSPESSFNYYLSNKTFTTNERLIFYTKYKAIDLSSCILPGSVGNNIDIISNGLIKIFEGKMVFNKAIYDFLLENISYNTIDLNTTKLPNDKHFTTLLDYEQIVETDSFHFDKMVITAETNQIYYNKVIKAHQDAINFIDNTNIELQATNGEIRDIRNPDHLDERFVLININPSKPESFNYGDCLIKVKSSMLGNMSELHANPNGLNDNCVKHDTPNGLGIGHITGFNLY